MTYVRGDKAQFDAWEAMGNPGWNWKTMFKYYKELEQLVPPTPDQEDTGAQYNPDYHGSDGDLIVGFNPDHPFRSFYEMSRDTWAGLDQDLNVDPNGGVTEGFSVWPQTLDPVKNKRSDAATSFFWSVENRPNLHLIQGTGSRVTWKHGDSEPSVESVEYVARDNTTVVLKVKKEAIFSAGALRTPLLLELSGVGDAGLLNDLGIETVVNLPAVGENMIDQPNNALIYNATEEYQNDGYPTFATFVTAKDLFGKDFEEVARETKENLPVYAKLVADSTGGRLNAAAVEKLFEIQYNLMFEDDTTIAEILTMAQDRLLVSAFWALMPFSRGSVHLSSTKAINAPKIDPQFLQFPLDLDSQIETARLASRFWGATGFVGSLVNALPTNAAHGEWATFIKQTMSSNSHSLGTAAMMSKELGGVVDSELKVYGTKGLRVVDASVLPMQFSGHLTATLYVIAQRAAEMILSEA